MLFARNFKGDVRPMKEYWITITFTVHARDEQEAIEIAADLKEQAARGQFKVANAEVNEIEEA